LLRPFEKKLLPRALAFFELVRPVDRSQFQRPVAQGRVKGAAPSAGDFLTDARHRKAVASCAQANPGRICSGNSQLARRSPSPPRSQSIPQGGWLKNWAYRALSQGSFEQLHGISPWITGREHVPRNPHESLIGSPCTLPTDRHALGVHGTAINLHGGPMHSSPFSGRPSHCAMPHSSLTKDQNERAGDDAHGGGATCARTAGWQGVRPACIANQQ